MFATVHAAGSSLLGLFSSCTTFDSTRLRVGFAGVCIYDEQMIYTCDMHEYEMARIWIWWYGCGQVAPARRRGARRNAGAR
eukprot:scaffold9431_cov111-Isochrysis_galbana.AAC.4